MYCNTVLDDRCVVIFFLHTGLYKSVCLLGDVWTDDVWGQNLHAGPKAADHPGTQATTRLFSWQDWSKSEEQTMLFPVVCQHKPPHQCHAVFDFPFSLSSDQIREVLKMDDQIHSLAEELYQQKSLLVMGRGYNFATCLEGALVRMCGMSYSEGSFASWWNYCWCLLLETGQSHQTVLVPWSHCFLSL